MDVHRSVDLEPVDVVTVGGIPVTRPSRTLCDAGLIFPEREIQRLVDHAVATGLTTARELSSIRSRVGEHGRNGVVKLETAVDHLPGTADRAESGPENQLVRILTSSGLPAPEVQYPVRINGRNYRIDLAYPDVMLGLEYDGIEAHSGATAFVSDRRRQNDLLDAGWTIRRYTGADLRDRPEAVITGVRRLLRAA
ncbi:MAG TPA: hypothetical protein ENI86_18775 [Acidimicrobiales bacterium]|nr:hypothetical protein [Acidimicrobiales bacterium]